MAGGMDRDGGEAHDQLGVVGKQPRPVFPCRGLVFGMDQLEARIRAVLRRTETEEPDEPLRVGDLVIDAVTRSCTLGLRTSSRVELGFLYITIADTMFDYVIRFISSIA